MEDKLNPADVNEKKDDKSDGKLQFDDSRIIAPTWSNKVDSGSLTGVHSLSEQASTEDTELSPADSSGKVFSHKTKTVPVHEVHNSSGASICSARSVEKDQPRPLQAALPSSTEARTAPDGSQSFTSIRSQGRQKTTTVHTEADGGDLCATILLACLFCHPLDCLLATMRGCNTCVGSLCASLCLPLCGCEPTALQPLLDVSENCDTCGCLGVRCFLCDCPICDICLQATECLELAMEISQMLYH
ncbi:myoD family inhibitor domain-containing protein 2-like [Melanotaenia boesemani]|uniref:myoD family inhibitor domain-containing protein 2-like n=1 Tax=Melanotaenia boesemani TaxID=1250792 RepID=UPI001C047C09|nr:myoD family inhibitor domain-containing protein 2-like [Melanotaenia boesemani]